MHRNIFGEQFIVPVIKIIHCYYLSFLGSLSSGLGLTGTGADLVGK
ncbi:hypothetical protein CRENPOLYSF2_500015 [Crenothrix polyspora]|uniref:Uncharacterized protein n=1 Tax=Crenothrix polyspora TaxID=360316 RepID=A0A1R4HGB6_9GAMM|nr:hypothetical protein CRENPOLYSF2_500015 [Crenothrix polyspora]